MDYFFLIVPALIIINTGLYLFNRWWFTMLTIGFLSGMLTF